MSPIEQVRPTLPGNTIRRPDGRNKRRVDEAQRDRKQNDGRGPGADRDERPGSSEHIVDELA